MDKINKNLVLFCNSISKNNDYFFLINEIRLSRNFFKKITIVPLKINLTELDDFKYENVYIDNSKSMNNNIDVDSLGEIIATIESNLNDKILNTHCVFDGTHDFKHHLMRVT